MKKRSLINLNEASAVAQEGCQYGGKKKMDESWIWLNFCQPATLHHPATSFQSNMYNCTSLVWSLLKLSDRLLKQDCLDHISCLSVTWNNKPPSKAAPCIVFMQACFQSEHPLKCSMACCQSLQLHFAHVEPCSRWMSYLAAHIIFTPLASFAKLQVWKQTRSPCNPDS